MYRHACIAVAFVFLVLTGSARTASAQNSLPSITDRQTPLALAKGAHPLGSYGGSDIDRINLFNGNTSMTFPLESFDGRAGMGVGVTLSYNSAFWRTEQGASSPEDTIYAPTYFEWDPGAPALAPGWRLHAGLMVGRRAGWNPVNCNSPTTGPFQVWHQTLTRFTFTAPDGTEYEFRDQMHGGQMITASFNGNPCPGDFQDYDPVQHNRGRIWTTFDGTFATFVSDQDVHDQHRVAEGENYKFVWGTGFIFLRDGTHYRVVDGKVRWQKDRNGNLVHYGYDDQDRLNLVTDTRGRAIEIKYVDQLLQSDPGVLLLVTSKATDAMGAPTIRTTKVRYGWLHDNFRDPGTSPMTYGQTRKGDGLFNGLRGNADVLFDPEFMVTSVEVQSGHAWTFKYNVYGEIVRMNTPAGGRIDYGYGFGSVTSLDENSPCGPVIFRRTRYRATYPVAGGAAETHTTYTDPSLPTTGDELTVVERNLAGDENGAELSRVEHTFWGSPNAGFLGTCSLIGPQPQNGTGYPAWLEGKEIRTDVYEGTTRLSWNATEWQQGDGRTVPDTQPQFHPRVLSTTSALVVPNEPSGPVQNKVKKTLFDEYDAFNNVTLEKHFDYGDGAPGPVLRQVRRTFRTDAANLVNGQPIGPGIQDTDNDGDLEQIAHLRSLVLREEVLNGPGTLVESRTDFEYDVISGAHNAPLLARAVPTSAAGRTLHDTTNYGTDRTMRGNVTGVASVDPSTGLTLSKGYTNFDVCGNVVRAIDPRGTPTTIEFYATTQFAYPAATSVTVGGQALTTSTSYQHDTGAISQHTGYNGEKTTYFYNDPLKRLTAVEFPTGFGRTEYIYSSSTNPLAVTVRSERGDLGQEQWVSATAFFDGLFRPYRLEQDDAVRPVHTLTYYDGLGRPWLTSNPYRPEEQPETTDGWTRTKYDALGRVKEVASFAGRTAPGPDVTTWTGVVRTQYVGNATIVTDQANKQRSSLMDGLGRLTKVTEASNVPSLATDTTYDYDARGNLRKVTQGRVAPYQNRYFGYDAMGRLVRASNPEQSGGSFVPYTDPVTGNASWTLAYQYDPSSNLVERRDARPMTITYGYDELNRMTTKDYSTSGPGTDVLNVYDRAPHPNGFPAPSWSNARGNPLGRLYGTVTYASAATGQEQTGSFYDYDWGGRATRYSQLVGGTLYETTTTYDVASAPRQMQHKQGGSQFLAAENIYNSVGQLYTVERNGNPMGKTAVYSAPGALVEQQLGNDLLHRIEYNSRLQPRKITLGTSASPADRLKLIYEYDTQTATTLGQLVLNGGLQPGTNNGNPSRITITPGVKADGTDADAFEQDFVYDELNRLKYAREFFASGGDPGPGPCSSQRPDGLATSTGNARIILSWTDRSGDETGFEIQRKVDAGAYESLGTVGPNMTQYEDMALVAGQHTYTYQVRALGSCAPTWSDPVSQFYDLSGPSVLAPNLVSATAITANRVELVWNDPNDIEGGFRVYRRELSPSPSGWSSIGQLSSNSATTITWSDVTVLASRQYEYYVVAYTIQGNNGPESNHRTVTTPPATPNSAGTDTIGTWKFTPASGTIPEKGQWQWRNTNSAGTNHFSQDWRITGMTADWTPVRGDYNGDGHDTMGYYDPVARKFHLSDRRPAVNNRTDYAPVLTQAPAGGRPVIGNWDGSTTLGNVDTIGVYDPATGTFHLRNTNAAVGTTITFGFGPAGAGWLPVAGDWDNDNVDTIGLYDPVTSTFFLRNSNAAGDADVAFPYGAPGGGWLPVAGDWDGDGQDTIGLYDPATRTWFLKNSLSGGAADLQFVYGQTGAKPVVGDWDNTFTAGKQSTPRRALRGDGAGAGGDQGDGPEQFIVAEGTSWTQEFVYDEFGNRTFGSGTTPSLSRDVAINRATNRLTHVDGVSITFDGAGNQVTDRQAGRNQTYEYDAENRMWKATVSQTGQPTVATTYVYDGDGRRVKKKILSGVETTFVYGPGGSLIAEYEGTTRKKEYVYGASGLLAVVENPGSGEEVQYVTPDHLGTPRAITRGDKSIKSRHDYLPFGEEIAAVAAFRRDGVALGYVGADSIRQKFTSKERDTETGLDFFQARYYAASHGRFLSPDEFKGGPDELYGFAERASANPTFYADLANPQSLNKYHYCFNNPLRYVDPDGHFPQDGDKDHATSNALFAVGNTALVVSGVSLAASAGIVDIPVTLPTAVGAAGFALGSYALGIAVRIYEDSGKSENPIGSSPPPSTQTPTIEAAPPAVSAQPAAPPPAAEARRSKGKENRGGKEHTKGKSKSKEGKHEKGQAAKQRSKGGEKGDKRRPYRKGGKTTNHDD